jgi:hypothetical protein
MVNTPGHSSVGVVRGGGSENAGAVGIFSENDPGEITGARYVKSPETDDDYRLRVGLDVLMDAETFNYASQNTGKHFHAFTTLTSTVSTNGLLTNSGASLATTVGMTFGTHAEFNVAHAATSVYTETTMALNVAMNAIPANAVIDVGLFRRGVTAAWAPTDGAYFRFSSAGITGVLNNNSTEVPTVLPVTGFLANEQHVYLIAYQERSVEFWIDNVLYATVETASTNGQVSRSVTLPWSLRHANTGVVGSSLQATITDYTISFGGPSVVSSLAQTGNRVFGAHQGGSGGTMGTLPLYANVAIPTSAAGSNTAANAVGLGGRGAINAVAGGAANDFVMTSYQVPAGTVAIPGRRLAIHGVKISCANLGAAVATTATTIGLSLAFGHTAVSLATAESASFATAAGTTKAARREALGLMYWNVAAPIGATPTNGDTSFRFTQPIYVNPGEFIATAMQFLVGTATASQSIWYHVTFDYGWE